eukprot:Gb_35528 [translate_table: standard]
MFVTSTVAIDTRDVIILLLPYLELISLLPNHICRRELLNIYIICR